MPLFYGDLYKPVSNILDSGYGKTTKFTVRTRPNTDLKLEATGERLENNALNAALKWTQTFRNSGIVYNVGGKLDNEGTVDINATAQGVITKGLDFGFDTKLKTDKNHKDNKVNFNATYTHDLVAIKAALEKKGNKKDVILTASATSDYEGLYAGVEGKLRAYPFPEKTESKDKKDELLKEFNFGLRYSTSNFHVSSQFNNLAEVKIGVAHNVSPKLSFAGEFKHRVKPEEDQTEKKDDKKEAPKPLAPPSWTFGGVYVVDSDSTVSAKISTTGVANAAYKVRLNSSVTTTLAFETQVNNLALPSKVGVSFDIDA